MATSPLPGDLVAHERHHRRQWSVELLPHAEHRRRSARGGSVPDRKGAADRRSRGELLGQADAGDIVGGPGHLHQRRLSDRQVRDDPLRRLVGPPFAGRPSPRGVDRPEELEKRTVLTLERVEDGCPPLPPHHPPTAFSSWALLIFERPATPRRRASA